MRFLVGRSGVLPEVGELGQLVLQQESALGQRVPGSQANPRICDLRIGVGLAHDDLPCFVVLDGVFRVEDMLLDRRGLLRGESRRSVVASQPLRVVADGVDVPRVPHEVRVRVLGPPCWAASSRMSLGRLRAPVSHSSECRIPDWAAPSRPSRAATRSPARAPPNTSRSNLRATSSHTVMPRCRRESFERASRALHGDYRLPAASLLRRSPMTETPGRGSFS